jgi:hypothetical protein
MTKLANTRRALGPPSGSAAQPTAEPGALTGEIRARIACKAYELYEQRGRGHGRELDDWLEAERIVLAELHRAGS